MDRSSGRRGAGPAQKKLLWAELPCSLIKSWSLSSDLCRFFTAAGVWSGGPQSVPALRVPFVGVHGFAFSLIIKRHLALSFAHRVALCVCARVTGEGVSLSYLQMLLVFRLYKKTNGLSQKKCS